MPNQGDNIFGNLNMSSFQGDEVEVDTSEDQTEQGEQTENTSKEEDTTSQTEDSKSSEEEPEDTIEVEEESQEDKEGLEDEIKDFNKKEEDPPSKEESPDGSPSAYSSLASALYEEGVLSSLTDEEKKNISSASDLVSLVSDKVEEEKKNYISSLDEKTRELADAIDKGVPMDEYSKAKAEEEKLSNIDDSTLSEDEELQKNVLKQDLVSKGYSEERADKFISNFEDTGTLEEEAKSSLSEIKEVKKKEAEEIKRKTEEKQKEIEKKQKEQIENTKETIKSKDEIIPGMEVNEQTKDKVFNSMTTVAGTDDQGNPLDIVMKSWMEDSEYPIKLHYLHQITDGFQDFSKLISSSKSSAVKDLEEKISQGGSRSGKPKGTSKDGGGSNKKDWKSTLSNLPGLGNEE